MNKRRRTHLHCVLDDLDKLKNVTDIAVALREIASRTS